MDKRGLNQSELARISNLSRQVISDYVTRKKLKPDKEALLKLAYGLKLPPETLFRAAGILPARPEINERTMEMNELYEQLSDDDQEEVNEFVRMKREIGERRGKYEARHEGKEMPRAVEDVG